MTDISTILVPGSNVNMAALRNWLSDLYDTTLAAPAVINIVTHGAALDGVTDDTAAFTAAAAAAVAAGKPLYIPSSGVCLLASTPGAATGSGTAITVTAATLRIIGDGMGVSIIRREAGSVSANAQCLLRFLGENGATLIVENLTLDFNCENNVTPGGDLENNFAWQHNESLEIRTDGGVGEWELVEVRNVEIRDPISDGVSFRGGGTGGAGVKRFICDNVRNDKWSTKEVRPRVRGDITITGVADEIYIRNCRLPRLHFERDLQLVSSHVSYVTMSNNEVGELLLHDPALLAPAERRAVNVGGSINYMFFQGTAGSGQSAIRHVGTTFNLRKTDGSRLTAGDHYFEDCEFNVCDEYAATPATEQYLIAAVGSAIPGRIVVNGGSLNVLSGAVAPAYFMQTYDDHTGPFEIGGGFAWNATGMQLTQYKNLSVRVNGVRCDYAGGGIQGGAWMVGAANTTAGTHDATIDNLYMTNSSAVVVCPPFNALSGTGTITTLNLGRNIRATTIVDLASATYGVGAAANLGGSWQYGSGTEIAFSVTYNPASLALGVSDAIQTTTVAGAALGDKVKDITFSINSAGMTFPAWVSAANTVSYHAHNLGGANPLDLASGTLSGVVRKA